MDLISKSTVNVLEGSVASTQQVYLKLDRERIDATDLEILHDLCTFALQFEHHGYTVYISVDDSLVLARIEMSHQNCSSFR
jgi:hypothetical protein